MSVVNLLEQTIQIISSNGKDVSEVRWVGSQDGKYSLTWEQCATSFEGLTYYSKYGRQEVASDLVVVGENWWLERHDYDGAEWWEFKSLPVKAENSIPFTTVKGDGWSTLDEINSEDKRG